MVMSSLVCIRNENPNVVFFFFLAVMNQTGCMMHVGRVEAGDKNNNWTLFNLKQTHNANVQNVNVSQ